jgi:hypothetical protein
VVASSTERHWKSTLRPVSWFLCQRGNSLTQRQRDLWISSKQISSNRSRPRKKWLVRRERVKAFKKQDKIGRLLHKISVQSSKLSKKITSIKRKKMSNAKKKKNKWKLFLANFARSRLPKFSYKSTYKIVLRENRWKRRRRKRRNDVNSD